MNTARLLLRNSNRAVYDETTMTAKHLRLAGALLLVLLLGVGGYYAYAGYLNRPRELIFAVPPGTVDRIAAGETVRIFPDVITLALDDKNTLVIRNDDAKPITVGPFQIQPGQSFRQQYFNPGTFELLCSVHGGQSLKIIVQRSAAAAFTAPPATTH